jgi:hypothetical protein
MGDSSTDHPSIATPSRRLWPLWREAREVLNGIPWILRIGAQ